MIINTWLNWLFQFCSSYILLVKIQFTANYIFGVSVLGVWKYSSYSVILKRSKSNCLTLKHKTLNIFKLVKIWLSQLWRVMHEDLFGIFTLTVQKWAQNKCQQSCLYSQLFEQRDKSFISPISVHLLVVLVSFYHALFIWIFEFIETSLSTR